MTYLKDAEETLSLSDDELYVNLGAQLQPSSFVRPPKDQLHKYALNWLNSQMQSLQSAICESDTVKRHTKEEAVLLIAVVADIIAAKFNLTNPATCAALLVRVGLNKICSETWD